MNSAEKLKPENQLSLDSWVNFCTRDDRKDILHKWNDYSRSMLTMYIQKVYHATHTFIYAMSDAVRKEEMICLQMVIGHMYGVPREEFQARFIEVYRCFNEAIVNLIIGQSE